jgi:predicted Rossmann-fold nucleotide-binding protein
VAWNLLQVGELATKPLVLLGSMWRQTMEAFINPEFVKQQDLGLLKIVDSPKKAVDFIQETLILD